MSGQLVSETEHSYISAAVYNVVYSYPWVLSNSYDTSDPMRIVAGTLLCCVVVNTVADVVVVGCTAVVTIVDCTAVVTAPDADCVVTTVPGVGD
jgi:hypothetical protein